MAKHTVLVAFDGLDFDRDNRFTAALSDETLKSYDGTGFDFQTKERHHFFYVVDETLQPVTEDINLAFGKTGLTGKVTLTMR